MKLSHHFGVKDENVFYTNQIKRVKLMFNVLNRESLNIPLDILASDIYRQIPLQPPFALPPLSAPLKGCAA